VANLSCLFSNLFFQFTDLCVQAYEVKNDTRKRDQKYGNNDPDFPIGPKPVSHLNLLSLTAERQQQQNAKDE
jgi:hypothetical protein